MNLLTHLVTYLRVQLYDSIKIIFDENFAIELNRRSHEYIAEGMTKTESTPDRLLLRRMDFQCSRTFGKLFEKQMKS